MTDDDYDALGQKQLASIKRAMRISLEDAVVRAAHKVMADFEAKSDERLMEDWGPGPHECHSLPERGPEQTAQQCRTDGRCQYAIDSGAEGMGHCPKGKCVMPAQQEPVAWFHLHNCEAYFTTEPSKDMVENYWKPLYTSPPRRKPLTDAEIWQMVNDCSFNRDLHADKFVRAIEAAHGIGDKT